MTLHNFQRSLELSHAYADAPWWAEVYERAFPGCEVQDLRADGWWQRAGIDRRVHLPNAATVTVDEKVREEDWPDILLECWSVWLGRKDHPRNKPGWIQYAACDYLAYAFVPSRRCYLLPMRELQRAWATHGEQWKIKAERRVDGFYKAVAENEGYQTLGVCVPIDVLMQAIQDAMLVNWSKTWEAAS